MPVLGGCIVYTPLLAVIFHDAKHDQVRILSTLPIIQIAYVVYSAFHLKRINKTSLKGKTPPLQGKNVSWGTHGGQL